jgi:hypothetical protein
MKAQSVVAGKNTFNYEQLRGLLDALVALKNSKNSGVFRTQKVTAKAKRLTSTAGAMLYALTEHIPMPSISSWKLLLIQKKNRAKSATVEEIMSVAERFLKSVKPK